MVPIYILTGFLGAGKTTLLRHLLENPSGLRLAVLRNEFTDEDIEFEVPLLVDEEDSAAFASFYELPNSCVCCTAKSQFLQAVSRLVEKSLEENRPFDAILVEVSGIADPGAVYENLIENKDEKDCFYVAGFVTVVDASSPRFQTLLWPAKGDQLDGVDSLALKQLTVADFVVLNKRDLIKDDAIDGVESAIADINPSAYCRW